MRQTLLVVTILLLGAVGLSAKEKNSPYKSIEAKHFTRAEGVELSPTFNDYLYAELRNELGKTKLFTQVIGEGEAVEDAEAPHSLVLEGNITEYKKGSVAKDVLIGFGAGMRSLKMEAIAKRRSDQQNIASISVHVKVSPRWNEKVMAKAAARDIANQLKKAMKQLGE